MSMRKEWFEEIDGKPSRFSDLYYGHLGSVSQSFGHAFRTLLAEDAAAGTPEPGDWLRESVHAHDELISEAMERIATLERKVKRLRKRDAVRVECIQELCEVAQDTIDRVKKLESFMFDAATTPAPTPRPFRDGDVVRLLDCNERRWTGSVGKIARIVIHEELPIVDDEGYAWMLSEGETHWTYWPASALELVTAVDAPEAEMNNEYLLGEVKQLEEHLAAMTKNRDDLYEAQQANERTHERGCEDMYNLMGENGKLRAERDALQAQLDAASDIAKCCCQIADAFIAELERTQ